jgi:hypothetical protein
MVAFRLKCAATLPGFDRSIQFEAQANDSVAIEIHCISDTALDKLGNQGDLLCTAELRKEPTRNIRQWLESPAQPLSAPAGFAEFANDAHDTLAKAIIRTLQLLRWRTGNRDMGNGLYNC